MMMDGARKIATNHSDLWRLLHVHVWNCFATTQTRRTQSDTSRLVHVLPRSPSTWIFHLLFPLLSSLCHIQISPVFPFHPSPVFPLDFYCSPAKRKSPTYSSNNVNSIPKAWEVSWYLDMEFDECCRLPWKRSYLVRQYEVCSNQDTDFLSISSHTRRGKKVSVC